MTDTKRIPIDEAEFSDLKAFAELALGLEVKTGTNASQLRAKIMTAMPGIVDVPAAAAPPPPVVAEGDPPARRVITAVEEEAMHLMDQANDPRVELTINKTDDKRRAKDVTMSVNGVTVRIQRGKRVSVPYRVYSVLNNAIEKQPVPTDDVNPLTGEYIMGWEDVHSYPFQIHSMPDEKDIKAWLAATSDKFQQPQSRAA